MGLARRIGTYMKLLGGVDLLVDVLLGLEINCLEGRLGDY